MDLREAIIEGLSYDLWANRKWVMALGGFEKHILEAQEALEHILLAQKVWLERCRVQVWEPEENVALDELFALYCEAWQAQIADRPLDEKIFYHNNAGQPYENTLGQIARHVIHHGAYHRGHLRGLASSDGFDGFPDTDFILYLREHEK